jgi:ABC-type thiamine transport system ATPase subunit
MLASELSGGMAQRVALARTLMSDRSIIVLDEPFSALDKDMKEKACSLILDYCKDGKTLILVSHMQEDAEALCTRKISVDK